MNTMTLIEILGRNGLDNLETIEIPGDETIALLRPKSYPEYAFLMRTKPLGGTMWRINFVLSRINRRLNKSDHYCVACTCPSYCMSSAIRQTVAETCQSNGVRVLFVRNARDMALYGDQVKVYEANFWEIADSAKYHRPIRDLFENVIFSRR